MWDMIVSVPDHCLSFYSEKNRQISVTENHRCVVIFKMSELRSFRNVLMFDAVSILSMLNYHNMTWDNFR